MNVSIQTPRLVLREIDSTRDDLGVYLTWLRDTQNNPFIQSARIDLSMGELLHFIESSNSDDNAILLGIFLNGFRENSSELLRCNLLII